MTTSEDIGPKLPMLTSLITITKQLQSNYVSATIRRYQCVFSLSNDFTISFHQNWVSVKISLFSQGFDKWPNFIDLIFISQPSSAEWECFVSVPDFLKEIIGIFFFLRFSGNNTKYITRFSFVDNTLTILGSQEWFYGIGVIRQLRLWKSQWSLY